MSADGNSEMVGMGNCPQQSHARLWAWACAVAFGTGEQPTGESTTGTATGSGGKRTNPSER
ncbi:hypothetical protein [Haloarcula rubripromontorii]|uniref:hypothetical protein n=1 Tax=Haloarcula rubripromontorii TaxID=1705562 RepID=UPI000AC32BE6|nr:hypothetical protein [Haloarcula rubripromontorii]